MTEKPYAMVPIGKNGELVRVEFGQTVEAKQFRCDDWCETRFIGYFPLERFPYRTTGGYQSCIRLPRPKRPEIADGELVSVRDSSCHDWRQRLFAGWDTDGMAKVWHTEKDTLSYRIVKTKDGTIWPPEVEG